MNKENEDLDRPESIPVSDMDSKGEGSSESMFQEDSKTINKDNDKQKDNKQSFSLKALTKKQMLLIGGGALFSLLLVCALIPAKSNQNNGSKFTEEVKMVPEAAFGGDKDAFAIQNALKENHIKDNESQKTEIKGLKSEISTLNDDNAKSLADLKEQLNALKEAQEKDRVNAKQIGTFEAPHAANANNEEMIRGNISGNVSMNSIQDFEIKFNAPLNSDLQRGQNDLTRSQYKYVPAGTFVKAVLLGGADANAAVGAQGNTTPILFRLLEQGTEPNYKNSHLKDCVVTAQTYGDISSDRAMVRLDRLSCNYPDGKTLDIPVYGTAYDIGGKNGIRGIEVLRNGKILTLTGFAGFGEGMAKAFQNAQTTVTPNLAGTNSVSVTPANSLQYAGLGGLSNAMNSLSSYYIQLAQQYHPIIQVNAGAVVDIIFTKGFSTDPDQSASDAKIANLANQEAHAHQNNDQTNPYGFASAPQTQSWQVPAGNVINSSTPYQDAMSWKQATENAQQTQQALGSVVGTGGN